MILTRKAKKSLLIEQKFVGGECNVDLLPWNCGKIVSEFLTYEEDISQC